VEERVTMGGQERGWVRIWFHLVGLGPEQEATALPHPGSNTPVPFTSLPHMNLNSHGTIGSHSFHRVHLVSYTSRECPIWENGGRSSQEEYDGDFRRAAPSGDAWGHHQGVIGGSDGA
jgi:hypothetical protein